MLINLTVQSLCRCNAIVLLFYFCWLHLFLLFSPMEIELSLDRARQACYYWAAASALSWPLFTVFCVLIWYIILLNCVFHRLYNPESIWSLHFKSKFPQKGRLLLLGVEGRHHAARDQFNRTQPFMSECLVYGEVCMPCEHTRRGYRSASGTFLVCSLLY